MDLKLREIKRENDWKIERLKDWKQIYERLTKEINKREASSILSNIKYQTVFQQPRSLITLIILIILNDSIKSIGATGQQYNMATGHRGIRAKEQKN